MSEHRFTFARIQSLTAQGVLTLPEWPRDWPARSATASRHIAGCSPAPWSSSTTGYLAPIEITCGRPACRCHIDPVARHGPYHYWTRKARGKTVGLKLTEDELGLYREWIENNRELERLVKEMRRVSSRVLALITGRQAP